METLNFSDAIKACRFCFMCRHLATVGNVTFSEADTPRGRALIADKTSKNPELLKNPDHSRTFFKEALSGACRFHCVSSYDEAGLALAVRRDIVKQGAVPENVRKTAEELITESKPKLDGNQGDVLYFEDPFTTEKQPEIAVAFKAALKKAGVKFMTISGSDSGKALRALGYWEEAKKIAGKIASLVAKSKCKTLVASCPAAFDAFKNDYPAMGVQLKGVRVAHSSEYLLELIEKGKLKVSDKKAATAYYLDSDFLKNYNKMKDTPRKLLAAVNVKVKEFGSNQEESYACGEGAAVLDRLEPELVGKLAERVLEKADDPKKDVLAVSSAGTKHALSQKGLKVKSVEEIVAERI